MSPVAELRERRSRTRDDIPWGRHAGRLPRAHRQRFVRAHLFQRGWGSFPGSSGRGPIMQSQGLASVGGQAGASAVRFTGRGNWRSQFPGTAGKRTGNTRGFAEIRRVPHATEVFSGRGGPTPIPSRNSSKCASQNCGRGLGFGPFSGAGAPSWGRPDVRGRLWSCYPSCIRQQSARLGRRSGP